MMGDRGRSETTERYCDPVLIELQLEDLAKIELRTAHLECQPIKLIPWAEAKQPPIWSKSERAKQQKAPVESEASVPHSAVPHQRWLTASGRYAQSRAVLSSCGDDLACFVITDAYRQSVDASYGIGIRMPPKQFFWMDDAFGAAQYQRHIADSWNWQMPLMAAALRKGATADRVGRGRWEGDRNGRFRT